MRCRVEEGHKVEKKAGFNPPRGTRKRTEVGVPLDLDLIAEGQRALESPHDGLDGRDGRRGEECTHPRGAQGQVQALRGAHAVAAGRGLLDVGVAKGGAEGPLHKGSEEALNAWPGIAHRVGGLPLHEQVDGGPRHHPAEDLHGSAAYRPACVDQNNQRIS